ncbi:MAG: 16S rRNA (cytosine(1402)-N(4))-methyltransferase [Paludibacter sp. 47-17]|jgi:16S rRNA (cytosine1402-N4)-methyltransferase|nr:MAG: 16S rRNA (cytosine(1402)-N(4))-methyltransferase [Paludibacter sp. 47-17]
MEERVYHTPALLPECLEGLAIRPDGVYVDCTFGGGGHSRAILERLGPAGRLYGFDQDSDALANRPSDPRFVFVHGNFRYIGNFMDYYGISKVDGILADLGVSFHHFDEAGRGFSFRFDGELDMRMNQKAVRSAAGVLNSYTEEQLADVFYLYGELHNSRKLARAIVKKREGGELKGIGEFAELMKPFFPREKEKKELTKVFQALRIEVNDEMGALKELLVRSVDLLAPGGRLVVLTYHSLEDRLVKNFIKTGNFEGKQEKDFYGNVIAPLYAVNTKVIVASDEEVGLNPRSRSAKLRIAGVKR